MLVLGLSIERIPWVCSYLPFWSFAIVELISHVVIGPFGGLLTVAVDNSHLFWHKFFGLSLPCRSAEGEMRGRRFFALFHFPKSWVDFGVGELYEILVGVDLLLFVLLGLNFGHRFDFCNFKIKRILFHSSNKLQIRCQQVSKGLFLMLATL